MTLCNSQVTKMRASNGDKLLLVGDGPRRQQLAAYAHHLGGLPV